MSDILLVNLSTVVSPAAFQAAANALQLQMNYHFTPLWGQASKIWLYTKEVPGYWPLFIMDNTDQADALGYHTRLTGGQAEGYVFAKTAEDDGVPWTVDMSHEAIELKVNPWVDCLIEGPYQSGTALYPREIGDPVEGSTYLVNGLPMSNFVTPLWFQSDDAAGPFDYLKVVGAPFRLAPGGYVALETSIGGAEIDVFGEKVVKGKTKKNRSGIYARTARRKRASWVSPQPYFRFGSVDSNLNYIISLLNQQTQMLVAQSSAIAMISTAISGTGDDPQALVDLKNQLKVSSDALLKVLSANQPK